MMQIDELNKFRAMQLLALNSVFQLILNNKFAECRRIKEHIAPEYSPNQEVYLQRHEKGRYVHFHDICYFSHKNMRM